LPRRAFGVGGFRDNIMSRAANLLLVLICWAAIYLPALGSLEIKGEEGRRILPAVTMLETGNCLCLRLVENRIFANRRW